MEARSIMLLDEIGMILAHLDRARRRLRGFSEIPLASVFFERHLSPAVAANDGKNLAGDVAGALRRSQKDIGRVDLLRLRGPLHGGVRTEFADILRLLVRRV